MNTSFFFFSCSLFLCQPTVERHLERLALETPIPAPVGPAWRTVNQWGRRAAPATVWCVRTPQSTECCSHAGTRVCATAACRTCSTAPCAGPSLSSPLALKTGQLQREAKERHDCTDNNYCALIFFHSSPLASDHLVLC